MAACRLRLSLIALLLASLLHITAAADATSVDSPLVANPPSIWSATPDAAPPAASFKPAPGPKPTPEESWAEAERLGLGPGHSPTNTAASNSTAAWDAVAGAPSPSTWSTQAESPIQSTAWEQSFAAAPGMPEPSAKSPVAAESAEDWTPSKSAAAAAGLVPGLPQSVGAESDSEVPSSGSTTGNAPAWAPASSQKKAGEENAAAQVPAPSKKVAAEDASSLPAKPPAPARKQPGGHVKAPGGKEAVPSNYIPESVRDVKWSGDNSAGGNASAKVYPTRANPGRSRPQQPSTGAKATTSGSGADAARSHTLDPTRVASTGSSSGAAVEDSTSGVQRQPVSRTANSDAAPPMQSLEPQEYIPRYDTGASRADGQAMIPTDPLVSANGEISVPSGTLAPAAAPAPGRSPANLNIPELLSPNVNATWHIIDSPPGATCEVLMRPYIVQQDGHTNLNLWGATEADRPPTASPPLDFLRGAVDLRIFNNASADIPVPYTLTIVSPPNVNYESAEHLTVASSGNGIGNLTATMADLAIPAGENLKANVSFTVNATNQDFYPRHVLLNGQACQLRIGLDLNVPIPTVLPNGTLIENDEQPASVTLGQFIGATGETLAIKGINWFGFETGSTAVDGLWEGPNAITQNFDSIAWRIKLLGFNTIRLPFSFQVLFNMAPQSYTAACSATTVDAVKQSVTPPGITTPAGLNPPLLTTPGDALGASGVCNADLPNTSAYARFLYVVRFFAANGFYVLIDNHLSFDNTAVSNTAQWLTWYKQLMTDIVQLPSTRNRVMIDIMNEPDVLGLRWKGTTPDMTSLYFAAMDALYPISPTTLFFVEGGGQLPYAMCWGDGFVTDPAIIAEYGLSDPSDFFTTLLTKPYLNNVVISPHYYPPSISTAKTGVSGNALWERMQNSFGYLTSGQGYQGHVFPVVIGETGSMYISQADVLFLSDMAKYMKNDPAVAAYPHATLEHLIWWAWNPNSGDTGGLVQDDWLTVIWNKVDYMMSAVGLQPWYAAVLDGGAPTPDATMAPVPDATSAPVPPATSAPDPPATTAAPAATVPPVQPSASTQPAATTAAPIDALPPPETTTSPSNTLQPPQVPASTQPPESTVSPETSSNPATAPVPPTTALPQTTPAPQSPPTQQSTPEPQATSAPQSTPESQTSSLPQTTSVPEITSVPQTTPALGADTGSGGACRVYAWAASVWSVGSGVWKASLDLHLQATGDSAIAVPYTLALSSPAYTNLESSWTWQATTSGSTLIGQVTQSWAALTRQGGNTVDVGGIVVGSSASLMPTQASINGVTCELMT
ncbi:probable major extracellular endoglucanase at C-terminar half [Coccomyxa sp. Obi]|nr:probable major extracellular endoglucanase at C-terminar half [Coccomyxa sp. Obi]